MTTGSLGISPSANDDYLYCRAFLHSWESSAPPLWFHGTGDHTLFLVCTRCGTEKHLDLNPDGTIHRPYYYWDRGYKDWLRKDDGNTVPKSEVRQEIYRRQQKARKAGKK